MFKALDTQAWKGKEIFKEFDQTGEGDHRVGKEQKDIGNENTSLMMIPLPPYTSGGGGALMG